MSAFWFERATQDELAVAGWVALLAILDQPWKTLRRSVGNGRVEEFYICPGCRRDVDLTPHAPHCCWLVAAERCGIA